MSVSGKGIEAGKGFVTLGVESSALHRGLQAAEQRFKKFGTDAMAIGAKIMAVGGMVTAPFMAAMHTFATMGDDTAKAAARIGVTVEALSELRHAAGQSGASAEELENSLLRMHRTLNGLAEDAPAAAQALADLRIDPAALRGLDPTRQMEVFADAIQGIEDPSRRAALAMEVFGRGGARLLPMLRSGSAGINQLREEARRLGLSMSGEDAAAAEQFTDALSRLRKTATMVMFSIGAGVVPVVARFVEIATKAATDTITWAKENRELLQTVLKVGLAVTATGASIMTFGAAVYGLSYAFTALRIVTGASVIALWAKNAALAVAKVAVVAYSAVVAVCSAVVGVFTGVTWANVAALAAFAVGIGAAILVGYALVKMFDNWNAIIGPWSEVWSHLSTAAVQAFGAISNAVSAGEWMMAFDIALKSVELLWVQTWNKIRNAFFGADYLLRNAWDEFTTWLAHTMVDVGSSIVEVFHTISDALKDTMLSAVGFVVTEFNRLISLMPQSIRTQLGVDVIPWSTKGIAKQRELDRAARAATTAGIHAEIDRDAGLGERERADAHFRERERARLEEAGLERELENLARDAEMAAFLADAERRMAAMTPPTVDWPGRGDSSIGIRQASGSIQALGLSGFAGSPADRAARATEGLLAAALDEVALLREEFRTAETRHRELLSEVAARVS